MEPQIEELMVLRLWPTVIADIIAEYSKHTLEDRIDCLIPSGYRDPYFVVSTYEMCVWYGSLVRDRPPFLTFSFWPGSDRNRYTPYISPETLITSLYTNVWTTMDYVRTCLITAEERQVLDKWLFSITKSEWKAYHDRKRPEELD